MEKLSDSSKLTYLRSFLSGYAFKVISHLSISDDNYAVALTLLKDEFLDVPYIVDSCFQQILSMSSKFDLLLLESARTSIKCSYCFMN